MLWALESRSHYSYVMQRCGLGKIAPSQYTLLTYDRQGSWPYHLQAAALGKVGPAPYLSSTVVLTLLTDWQVNLLPECECETTGPTFICHIVVCAGRVLLLCLWQEGELSLRSWVWECSTCPLPIEAFQRMTPAPCLGNTVKLPLMVQVWRTDPVGKKAGELTLPLALVARNELISAMLELSCWWGQC